MSFRSSQQMPLVCEQALADALVSVDALRALHEGPSGPIDLDQGYSTLSDTWADQPHDVIRDADNPRLMFAAVRAGRVDVVRYIAEQLTASGTDPHASKGDGATPCLIAAAYGHESCIRALVELGADPNHVIMD